MKAFLGSQQISLTPGASKVMKLARGASPIWSRVGVDWYARSMPTQQDTIWLSVAFGNNVFVAVAQDGTGFGKGPSSIATSSDGVTWTARTAPLSPSWSRIIFANGVFLATGGGVVARSADGITWETATLSSVTGVLHLAYGAGRFVAYVRNSNGTATIRHSADGLSWSSDVFSSGTSNIGRLFYGLGKFYTIGGTSGASYTGTSTNVTSTDGITWTSAPLTSGNFFASYISNVIEKDGILYGTSGSYGFFTSTDGVVWSQASSIGGTNTFGSLALADGMFLIGEQSSSGTNRVRIYTSTDFVNWSASSTSPRSINVRSIAHGNGVAVTVGDSGPSRSMSSSTRPELAIQASELLRAVAGQGQATAVVMDAKYSRSSSATTVTDYAVRVTFGSAVASDVTYTSSNAGVLSVPDSRGIASWVSDGTATLTATDSRGMTASTTLPAATRYVSAVDTFVEYNAGTAARSACDAVDLAIAGGGQKAIFSTKDHATATYVRNTSCWIHGRHDFTSHSVWNSVSGAAQCGTLISPRHVLWAAHYPLPVGTTFRWVKLDGTVVTGTVSAKAKPQTVSAYYPDFEIGLLSADIGSGISHARVLPSNWRSKFPSLSYKSPIPVCVTDQDENALVADWFSDGSQYINCQTPASATRISYFENLITGDSGHPCFLLLNGVQSPVLLTVWTYGGAGSGTSIAMNRDTINSLMSQLGGGYQLTEADLSGFPSY